MSTTRITTEIELACLSCNPSFALTRLATNGSVDAMTRLAMIYNKKQHFDIANKYFKMAIDHGGIEGCYQYIVNNRYDDELYFKDMILILKKACDNGHLRAKILFIKMMNQNYDEDQVKNEKESYVHLCEQYIQDLLKLKYKEEYVLRKTIQFYVLRSDVSKLELYLPRFIDTTDVNHTHVHVNNMRYLAELYEEIPIFLPHQQCLEKRLFWLQNAADKGDCISMYRLGKYYHQEQQAPDLERALHYYQQAWENGHLFSKKMIEKINNKHKYLEYRTQVLQNLSQHLSEKCPICWESESHKNMLRCGHLVCIECFCNIHSCPTCKDSFNDDDDDDDDGSEEDSQYWDSDSDSDSEESI